MYSLMYYIPSMSGASAPMRLQNWSGLAWTRVRSRLQKFNRSYLDLDYMALLL